MHNNNQVISLLRSPNAVLGVLVLALIAQTPHAADVFRMIGHSSGLLSFLHSYSFAIALELAVLVFVIQSRKIESYGFAAVSIAMNLSYYFLTGNVLFSVAALPDWLVSIALPVAIARYSHVAVEVRPDVQPERKTKPTQVKAMAAAQSEPAHNEPVNDAQSESPTSTDADTIDKRYRAQQLRTEGLSYAQIAQELDVHRNTIANWLKQTNGHSAPEAAQ